MKKKNRKKLIAYLLLIVFSLMMLFPFYWMVRSSFMSKREIMTVPIQWLPSHVNLDNFRDAFARAPFARYFLNSVVIVLINMAGSILSSSFIAFGFARLKFRGRNIWFALLLSTMMIPQTVLMIPQFLIWQRVGAYNTFIPLTLPCFFGNAFNVFLVRQFYAGIPKDYDEAALVDGANYFTIYWKIILPMSKPVMCTVGVFTFMGTWNDFMGPLLYLDKKNLKTVSLALQNFMGQHNSEWNLLMALATVITLPMITVYFIAQRYFIEGITFSGIKG
ncbi:MAG: carbohydrate ABC transporter permease [Lachnospiraceae bacterium]|nr:carbohydrate ABC transporter permease [Lachnospiraceae bacterium]